MSHPKPASLIVRIAAVVTLGCSSESPAAHAQADAGEVGTLDTSEGALDEPTEEVLDEALWGADTDKAVGSTIVFTKLSENQGQNEVLVAEIYAVDPDGSNQRRITTNTTFDLFAE